MISATTYLAVVIGGGFLGYWTPEIIWKIRRRSKTGIPLCRRPPAGWGCSRDVDHEGPCAARPLIYVSSKIPARSLRRFKAAWAEQKLQAGPPQWKKPIITNGFPVWMVRVFAWLMRRVRFNKPE